MRSHRSVVEAHRRQRSIVRPDFARHKGERGSTSTVVTIPGASEEEKSLQRKQVELLELQIGEAKRQSALLEETFPASRALLQEQISLTKELATFQRAQLVRQEGLEKQLLTAFEAEKETPQQQELRDLSEKRALAILRGDAPVLSAQQEGLIEDTFKSAETEAKTGLRQFAEELAASRGLRLTDAPIGAEVAREGGQITSRLASAKAASKLAAGETQQIFQQNVAQFREGLRQQAFMNRLALTGREAPGLGLAAAGAPNLLLGGRNSLDAAAVTGGHILDRMQQARFGAAGRTSSFSTGGEFDLAGIGGVLGGVGALARGAAALKPFFPSTARVKTDIEPLDRDEYERARRSVANTPVVRYRYQWDRVGEPKRLGILIETSPPEVSRDGLSLDVPGYLGLTLAAVKGVDRRVDRLERGLGFARKAA